MLYRKLGASGLEVSVICLGTMTYGTPVAEPDAVRLTHWAVDHGINFIDTANSYEGYNRYIGSPGGVAEEILGSALAGRRDKVVLATKVGNPVGPGADERGLSRAHVLRELDKSLRRMKTDWVDVYYMHRPDPNTPLEESIAAFSELVGSGKVRHWGFSNFDAAQVAEMLKICTARGFPRPVVNQPPFSLLKRDIEQDLLPLCVREGIAVVPFQVLQGGLLTGKYRRGRPAPEGSRKAEKPDWAWELTDELFDKLERIEVDARAAGLTMTQYALGQVLSLPGITSAVIGVKSIGQLSELICALEGHDAQRKQC